MPDGRWTDAFLDAKRPIGDPSADGVVAAIFASGQVDAINNLMRSLVRNDQPPPEDLPAEVRDYLDAGDRLPAWADPSLIQLGEECFRRWGMQMCMALLCASLPACYAASKQVKVLHDTARFSSDLKRRVMETSQFLFDILSPGGLSPHGQGIRAAQKVRIMHAAVRHLILDADARDPSVWDGAWGVPLNQEDLTGALVSFSWKVLDALQRLGIVIPQEHAAAFLHCWTVAGSLLGIQDDMLPRDLDDAALFAAAMERRHYAASPEGAEMTRALVELLQGLAPGPLLHDAPEAMIRFLVGGEVAALIGLQVPPRGWIVLKPLLALLAFIDRIGERRHLGDVSGMFGRAIVENSALARRGGNRTPFYVPATLREEWQIRPPERIRELQDQVAAVAEDAGKRVEALAAVPWAMALHRRGLLYLHWPVEADELREVMHDPFTPEVFAGSAWVTLVLMRLETLQFQQGSGVPLLRDEQHLFFADEFQMDLRTYAQAQGRGGAYYLSVDLSSGAAGDLVRRLLHLPAFSAEISWDGAASAELAGEIRAQRAGGGPAGVSGQFRWHDRLMDIDPGSVDAFLLGHDQIYARDPEAVPVHSQTHDSPRVLHQAEAEVDVSGLFAAVGLHPPSSAPLARYVVEATRLAWPPERLPA